MRKMQKIIPDPIFFYEGQNFQRQCVNLIDIAWLFIFLRAKISDEIFRLGVQWPLRSQFAALIAFFGNFMT